MAKVTSKWLLVYLYTTHITHIDEQQKKNCITAKLESDGQSDQENVQTK